MTAAAPSPPAAADPLVVADGLVKHFPIRKGLLVSRQVGAVKAVDGVSLAIRRGETLGLVGESGCGKTTLGRLLLRLIEPTAGRVAFDGVDVLALHGRGLRRLRRGMQIVFQDPFGSLDPRMTVEDIVAEPLVIHGVGSFRERAARVRELLDVVGLAAYHADRFPHEFSGGQRQRIGIARALALNPKFVVCDEAVSALDVSIQAQIINLLRDLKAEFRLTYLFISHDLGVIRHISDRIAVMYLGRIVEFADKARLFAGPKHPYTQALLSAIPVPKAGRRHRRNRAPGGDIPSPIDPPAGCHFHPRCPFAMDVCRVRYPPLVGAGDGHLTACHLVTPHAAARDIPAEPRRQAGGA